MSKAVVLSVEEGSAAFEGGIEAGDILLSINGKKIKDIFDYKFYTSEEEVELVLLDKDSNEYVVQIEKDMYEDLGIDFENSLLDDDKRCSNNCIFCFIDQLPKGMRDTVYFKDDDTRLSFLTGNYVTLTNVDKNELDRIVKYKLSPVNVSVQTTNPKLRSFMLGNKKATDIMDKLKTLCDGGIDVNCQIVLCPSINDGQELENTMKDLISLSYGIKSVSIVPVGLTKYRDELYKLRLFTEAECANVVEYITILQKKLKIDIGTAFVYVADEFYLKADVEMPDYESYEDFPQLENGVGMVSSLQYEVKEYLNENKQMLAKALINKKVSIATGTASYGIIEKLVSMITKYVPKLSVTVYSITNNYFGDTVTVSGLLTGSDLIAQLKDKDLGQALLISNNMLRRGETVFLDDMTLEQLQHSLGVSVCPVLDSGKDFVEKILRGGMSVE